MSMQEIALDALLAAGFAVLAVLAVQARKSRAAAERDVEAERSTTCWPRPPGWPTSSTKAACSSASPRRRSSSCPPSAAS
jgi:threonine/homoserine/homoserine lactone efflux protein